MFDEDGSGSITTEELMEALKKMGQNPSEDELRKMVEQADEDGSGLIEFDEFLLLI